MHPILSKYLFYYPVTLLHGENIAKYFSQYNQFQWLAREDIAEYQLKHLKNLLLNARKYVPYYRDLFEESDINIEDIRSLEDLKHIPSVAKKQVVENPRGFKSEQKFLFVSNKTTGGSTGESVTIAKNSDALARERAATWRGYEWAGVSIGDPQARFWGVPLRQKNRLMYKAVDFISNRKRFSAFNISPQSMENYYQELLQLKPIYFYGYVSILTEFAEFMQQKEYQPPSSLRAIITTSEVLSEKSRELLETVFRCQVYNEYGCGEVGSIAHECEHHNMHVMSDNLIVEIDHQTSSSDPGEIIVTDLFNYAMPLIRYRLGDYATLSDETCGCGRTLPLMSKIHGRAYDFIVSPDNRKHHPELMMYIFEELKEESAGIVQFQVVQSNKMQLDIYIVKGSTYSETTNMRLIDRIHEKVHPDLNISINFVDSIKREASGKLRLIKGLQSD